MYVTIKCYGAVRAAIGRKTVEIEMATGESVGDALDRLIDEHPSFADVRGSELVVMRDGSHVGETDAVADRDVLSVSNPPMVED